MLVYVSIARKNNTKELFLIFDQLQEPCKIQFTKRFVNNFLQMANKKNFLESVIQNSMHTECGTLVDVCENDLECEEESQVGTTFQSE